MKKIIEASDKLLKLYDSKKDGTSIFMLGREDKLEYILNHNINHFDEINQDELDLLFSTTYIRIIYKSLTAEIKKEKYGEVLHPLLIQRRTEVESELELSLNHLSFSYDKKGNWISYCYFGIEDTLKLIDEYIDEIKNSKQYKEYMDAKNIADRKANQK